MGSASVDPQLAGYSTPATEGSAICRVTRQPARAARGWPKGRCGCCARPSPRAEGVLTRRYDAPRIRAHRDHPDGRRSGWSQIRMAEIRVHPEGLRHYEAMNAALEHSDSPGLAPSIGLFGLSL